MQSNRPEARINARQSRARAADFDFGETLRGPGRSQAKKPRPGLAAGLIAFAFTVSLFIPVTAKAEPIYKRFTEPHSQPAPLPAEGKRWEHPELDKPQRKALPTVCVIEIDGPRSGLRGYSENCLRDRGVREKLPRGCAMNARLFGQRDRVYPSACLRDAGFRLRDN